MLDAIKNINDPINSFIWGFFGIVLLLGTGILTTSITKFFQITHFGHWWGETIGKLFKKNSDVTKNTEKHSISQFQALCTALSATLGTGNITGVAAAICIGGPGAVFWMWIAAFFGMMTNYSENILGIYFRRKNESGEWSGGAMYYLRDGLGSRKNCKTLGRILAVAFSCFAVLASFGIGNWGQINKIVINIEDAFTIPALSDIKLPGGASLYALIIGFIILIFTALVVLGGLKRIAKVAEKIVPVMAVVYIVGGLILIFMNAGLIGPAFAAIFKDAFGIRAVSGGAAGVVIADVIKQGCKRGIFSNEAGLGSSVMVHSASNVKEPVHQGMWGIFEVFFDTIIVCTMTALIVLTSGLLDLETGVLSPETTDATLVADIFGNAFGPVGKMFVAIAIAFFAYTTVLGWSFYGTKSFEYLFGTKAAKGYKVAFVILTLGGALMTSSLAWDISDTFNGLMMIPNLIGVVSLSGLVVKITNNYIERKIKGKKDVAPMYSFLDEIQKEVEDSNSMDD